MNSLREFLRDIKVEHTVFALPFAYMTLFLVSRGWPRLSTFAWITVAMVAGRTFGMAANRVIDAQIDARNPRTAARAVAAGRLRARAVVGYMGISFAVFLVAVWNLHPICRRLWPIVIVTMVVYPYAKRFTPLAHFFLGAVYLMIPTAIWLAVIGRLPGAALALGTGAALWVVGFDVIYACQDVDVDRRDGLHSIPADYGISVALSVARVAHGGFLLSMAWAAHALDGGYLFWSALAATALLLLWEHRLVRPGDLSRVNAAFFQTNGVVSMVLFVLVAADAVLRWR